MVAPATRNSATGDTDVICLGQAIFVSLDDVAPPLGRIVDRLIGHTASHDVIRCLARNAETARTRRTTGGATEHPTSLPQLFQIIYARFISLPAAPLLGAADIHLATLRGELCGLMVPSKVYGILAAGRPCVFLGPAGSEVARLIRDSDAGGVLEHSNGASLATEIDGWIDNPKRLEAAGVNALLASRAHNVQIAAKAFQRIGGFSAPGDDTGESAFPWPRIPIEDYHEAR